MKLTPKQYAEAWFQALTEADAEHFSVTCQLFLKHIYRHGHGKWLPEITRLIEGLEHKKNGTMAVKVRSTHPLPSHLLTSAIQKVLPNKQVVIQSLIDERVIGGVQIETTDQRWDLSLSGQLRHLTQTLSH